MIWLNYQLGNETLFYSRYRVRKLKFHFVPLLATTSSARGMWAAFYPDGAVAITDAKDDGVMSLSILQSSAGCIAFPAWQMTTLDCSRIVSKDWKYVAQPFADGTLGLSAGTMNDVTRRSLLSSYLQNHSFGTLVCTIDYTNSGGAPILDGYVFCEGVVEMDEPQPLFYSVANPALQGQRPHLVSSDGAVFLARPTVASGSHPQAEMKTLDPATTLDPQVAQAVPSPLVQSPLPQSRAQLEAAIRAQLSKFGSDVELVVEEDVAH